MNFLAALPQASTAKLIAGAVAVILAVAAYMWWEHRTESQGAAQCEAKAAQADAQRVQAAADQFRANEHAAQDAATTYEAKAQSIAARQPEARHAIQSALAAPAQCPASAPLADLVIPGAALDGLRSAAGSTGADTGAPR
jgi:Flp pilus assembly protein TadB